MPWPSFKTHRHSKWNFSVFSAAEMRNNVPKLPDKVMCCTRPISLYVPPSDGENYGKVFMQVEYAAAVVSENSIPWISI